VTVARLGLLELVPPLFQASVRADLGQGEPVERADYLEIVLESK